MAQITLTDREVRFRDGLGVRVATVDPSGNAVEQLRVTAELANQEAAIRERVGRLVNFRHVKYVRLRGVDRLKQGGKELAVSYDAVEGDRLSSILEKVGSLPVTLDVDVALQVVRDLLPGIGILHDSRKVSHGAIGPAHLIYTDQHRLVILDHGLGLALARMNQPRKKLWDQYRIAVPSSSRSVFDERTDVLQIGVVAVSLLLARPLTDEEFPGQLKRLTLGIKEHSAKYGPRPVSAELRQWLERALQLDDEHAFQTVREAQDAFETIVAAGRYTPSAAAVKAFLVRYREAARAAETPAAGSTNLVDRALEEFAITIGPKSPISKSKLTDSTQEPPAPQQPLPEHAIHQEAQPGHDVVPAPPAEPTRPLVVASAIDGHALGTVAPDATTGADSSGAPKPRPLRKTDRLSESSLGRERVGDAARRARLSSPRGELLRSTRAMPAERAKSEAGAGGRLDALRALEEELGRLAAMDLATPRQPEARVVDRPAAEGAAAAATPEESTPIAAASAGPEAPVPETPGAAAHDGPAIDGGPTVTGIPDAGATDSTAQVHQTAAAHPIDPGATTTLRSDRIDAELARLMGTRDPDECATPVWTIDEPAAEDPLAAAEAVAPRPVEPAAQDVPAMHAAVEPPATDDVEFEGDLGTLSFPPAGSEAVAGPRASDIRTAELDALTAWFELTPPSADAGRALESFELTPPVADTNPVERQARLELSAFEQAAYATYDAAEAQLSARQVTPLFDTEHLGHGESSGTVPSGSTTGDAPDVPAAAATPEDAGLSVIADLRGPAVDPSPAVESIPAAGVVDYSATGEVLFIDAGLAQGPLDPAAAVEPAFVAGRAAGPSASGNPDAATLAADARSTVPSLEMPSGDELGAVGEREDTRDGPAAQAAAALTGDGNRDLTVDDPAPAIPAALTSPIEAQAPFAATDAPSAQPSALTRVRRFFRRPGKPAEAPAEIVTDAGIDAVPAAADAAPVLELNAPGAADSAPDGPIEFEIDTIAQASGPAASEVPALEVAVHGPEFVEAVEAQLAVTALPSAEAVDVPRAGTIEAAATAATAHPPAPEPAPLEAAPVAVERETPPVVVPAPEAPAAAALIEPPPVAALEVMVAPEAVVVEHAAPEAPEAAARIEPPPVAAVEVVVAPEAAVVEHAAPEAPEAAARIEPHPAAAAEVMVASEAAVVAHAASEVPAAIPPVEAIPVAAAEVMAIEPAEHAIPALETPAPAAPVDASPAALDATAPGSPRSAPPPDQLVATRPAEVVEAVAPPLAIQVPARPADRAEAINLAAAPSIPAVEALEPVAPEAAVPVVPVLDAASIEGGTIAEAAAPASAEAAPHRSKRKRGRRRNKSHVQPPVTPVSASPVHASPAVHASVAAPPAGASLDALDPHATTAPAATPDAAPPAAEVEPPARTADHASFCEWDAPAADAVPAWARGTANAEPATSGEAPQHIGTVVFESPTITHDAFEQVSASVSGQQSAWLPRSDAGPAGARVAQFPAPAARDAHDASIGQPAARPAPSARPARRSLLRRINWGRTLAASLVVAFLEGAAFAAAWWYVTPTELGWLIVHTTPAGIEIGIDGLSRGRTPFALSLKPGRHTIELRQGTAERIIPVEISGGVQTEQRITWGKAFKTGQARITSTPEGARVLIDGKPHGATPVTVSELTAGKHSVTVEASAGSVTTSLIVEAGETTELDVPVYSGWLSVLAPVELEIFERGQLIGTSEAEKIMLAPGRHKLNLRNVRLGYAGTQSVDVRPGATTSVSVVPKAEVTVEGPAGTEVFVDGERVGALPIGGLKTPIGTREFVFRHPDQGERRQVVVVSLTGPVTVTF